MSSLKVRTLTELLSLEQPDQLFYLEPELLCYGGSMFMYGKAGTFKSFLAIELMHSMATGNPWLIYGTTGPIKSMMFQAEQVEVMYQERMLHYTRSRISTPADLDPYMLFTTSQNLKLDDPTGIAMLEQAIKEHGPKVVLIDCMYRVIKSSTEVASVGRFLDELARLSSIYGVAFVVIHHPRKESDDDRGFDELTGWAGIAAWADSIIRVTREEGTTNLRLKWEKTKNARREVSDVDVKVNQETLKFNLR